MDEQQAIRACKAGDMTAVGVLFELHHIAVFRTACAVTRNNDLAEDVTQQVFISAFRTIKSYDPSKPFPAWLHRIAVRRGLDELNRRGSQWEPIESAANMASTAKSPEQEAEDAEFRETVARALDRLDAKHRAAVVLRYIHGFDEAEMAEALHCRRGTVKSRLHNALKKLREILGDDAIIRTLSGVG